MVTHLKNLKSPDSSQQGFTLIELMIVVAIIAVLASIAYPSYESYIIKSNRADMMSELHNVASELQARKLAKGKYADVATTGLVGAFPRQGTQLYTISVTPSPLTSSWTVTATPSTSRMIGDGNLTLNYQNVKCRNIGTVKKCGTGDEWSR